MQHHPGDGAKRVAGGLAGIIVVDELGHNFGIGLGDKVEPAADQPVFQFLKVFNDAVVYHRDPLVLAVMRMGVDDARLAVGGPARVADAAAAGNGMAAIGHIAEHPQPSFRLDNLNFAGGVLHRNAGRIIAAIFKFGQTVQQNRGGLIPAGKTNNSTHR